MVSGVVKTPTGSSKDFYHPVRDEKKADLVGGANITQTAPPKIGGGELEERQEVLRASCLSPFGTEERGGNGKKDLSSVSSCSARRPTLELTRLMEAEEGFFLSSPMTEEGG